MTALFAEHTGTQQPLDVDWSLERGMRTTASSHRTVAEPSAVEEAPLAVAESPEPVEPHPAGVVSGVSRIESDHKP